MLRRFVPPMLWLVVVAMSPVAHACSSCGCTLNTDLGSQGVVSGIRGWRIGLRYDIVDQDQLRSGDSTVADPALPSADEVERRTRNGYYTLSLDYTFNRRWGVGMELPYLDRYHSTVAEGDATLSTSDSQSLSDVRVLGRYTGFAADMSTGLLFGLKLPTGSKGTRFDSGPQTGKLVDRSLQAGSGTTDVLLGMYHFDDFNGSSGWFAQAMYQHSLRVDAGFKPGDSLNLNLGLRYYWSDSLTPQLQFNVQARSHDTDADPSAHANSGGRLLYVSPGVTFNAGEGWHGYLFLQFPLFQHVYGLQLAPTRLISAGFSHSFGQE
ncbi:MAG TPA: hypothetical protein VGO35_01855 [Gammaproteobacteria bacterium]|nr:hypothetical protein [Gammaproteobacteria bacterium]